MCDDFGQIKSYSFRVVKGNLYFFVHQQEGEKNLLNYNVYKSALIPMDHVRSGAQGEG